MRLAQKLADRIVFLHEAKVIFFGTPEQMRTSEEPIVREFLQLDDLTIGDYGMHSQPAASGDEPRYA
jgi:phospholipid/cholesterol/gamma-HCH transport system ATP-binding protein